MTIFLMGYIKNKDSGNRYTAVHFFPCVLKVIHALKYESEDKKIV